MTAGRRDRDVPGTIDAKSRNSENQLPAPLPCDWPMARLLHTSWPALDRFRRLARLPSLSLALSPAFSRPSCSFQAFRYTKHSPRPSPTNRLAPVINLLGPVPAHKVVIATDFPSARASYYPQKSNPATHSLSGCTQHCAGLVAPAAALLLLLLPTSLELCRRFSVARGVGKRITVANEA